MLQFAPLPPAARDDKRLAMRVFGLNFPNPIGIAAGFDKNAEVPDALLRVGFGFVEVGTITPLPQPGNPRPRLFRLDADHGVINRLGFNSEGADAVLRRLAARAHGGGVVGINVGANKDAPDRIADYVGLIERFAAVASYVTVNISSPNTPGLRNMQQAAVLDDLLARVIDARERVAPQCRTDAGAAEDRARSFAARSRRCRRHRPLAPGRRHDRRQHHGGAAAALARRRESEGGRRIVGPAAVSARQPHAGRDLCAGRGRVSADRRRRHRFRRRARLQKSAPARASFSFIRDWCSAASALSPRSRRRFSPRSNATAKSSLADYIGADAASVTAEPWPGVASTAGNAAQRRGSRRRAPAPA